jgi:hypothetical protein
VPSSKNGKSGPRLPRQAIQGRRASAVALHSSASRAISGSLKAPQVDRTAFTSLD